MKKVYIVRHGETDNNRQHIFQGSGIDASLNETGFAQAEALCPFFQSRKIDEIAVSSLKRTYQTVQPVAVMKHLSVSTYSELDEMNFGELEGVPVQKASPKIDELRKKWEAGKTDEPVPGGESPEEVYQRGSQKIKQLLSDNTSQYWLFVLHGRLIRILLSGWLYGDLRYMLKIQHSNAGINVLQFDNGRFEPLLLNYTAHLNNHPAIAD